MGRRRAAVAPRAGRRRRKAAFTAPPCTPNTRKKEPEMTTNTSAPTPDTKGATIVVPVAVWEERQKTIRELGEIRARTEFDALNREIAAVTASLAADLAELRRIRRD